MSVLRSLLLLIVALAASGCATRSAAPVTQLVEARNCDMTSILKASAFLRLDEAQPDVLRFDGSVSCVGNREDAPSNSAVVRLPRFRQAWVLTLESELTGQSLFAPEVFTLDAQGKVLRSLPFERFTLRGNQLQASLFFGEDNAHEHYVLVRSANQAVGREGTQVVSGSFAVPILTGLLPILYMQGTEHERSYTLSHNGVVQLQARTAVQRRRPAQTHRLARAELGAMAR